MTKKFTDTPILLFNLLVLGALAMYVIVATTLNIWVDPYDSFPQLHSEQFKEGRKFDSRIARGNRIWRGGIDIALVGSSRVMGAFKNMENEWGGKTYYNMGLPSTSYREIRRASQHLFEHNKPEVLVVGIDFDVAATSPTHEFGTYRKSLINPDMYLSELMLEQALSMHMLKESIQLWSTPKGQVMDDPSLTRQKKFELLLGDSIFLSYTLNWPEHYPPSKWQELLTIRDLAKKSGTQLIFIMPPIHATVLTVWEEVGFWDRFENWKKDVVRHLASDVAVWDFTGYSDYQTESIPAPDAKSQDMKWYTDASHCNPTYGRVIIDRILSRKPTTVGTRLTPDNIEEVIAKIREDRAAYHENHPEQVAFVKALVKEKLANRQTDRGGDEH